MTKPVLIELVLCVVGHCVFNVLHLSLELALHVVEAKSKLLLCLGNDNRYPWICSKILALSYIQ